MDDGNPVVRLLKRRIADEGPLDVATFMAVALAHPEHGYYVTRDPLGAAGDFTTAPEISQMFGELVGLWCADTWQALGRPDPFALIEFGPGRGTLMADALRALAGVPACRDAARIHLVETSPVLRDMQRRTLAGHHAAWHERLPDTGGMPALVIANEFLDALPVEQYVRTNGAWHARRVGLSADTGTLCFVTDPAPAALDAALAPHAHEGAILERAPAVEAAVADIARHIVDDGGEALFIDYGYTAHATGETLQAVRGHKPIDVLAAPGESDLTAHVNFAAVAEAAAAQGARCHGPVDQGVFLERLGIRARARALSAHASPAQRTDIETALARLIGPAEMGTLFKVLAVARPDAAPPAGFETTP